MTDFAFYHLRTTSLERALAQLLTRVLERGKRAIVRASSDERAQALNISLWTQGRDDFLPHGTREDGFAEDQPVFLTARADYPNNAEVLILVDGAEAEDVSGFERCLYVFDGNDPELLAAARDLWKRLRDSGQPLTYWQQTERGGWQQAGATPPSNPA